MKTEVIHYQCNGNTFHGYLCYDERNNDIRPCVLVAHAWKGQDDFARKKAESLAGMGYIGFALDIFGNGKTVESDAEAKEMIAPLFTDRKLLRDRLASGYECMATHPLVDKGRIGAIGFCFGGLSVLELFKGGAKLKGTVSFHGLLGDTLGDMNAKTLPLANKLHGPLLVLHGYLDPLVPQQHVIDFQAEMSEAGVDWQMHTYGQASHAFSKPDANNPASGLLYNASADQRSWRSMKNFFEECFR